MEEEKGVLNKEKYERVIPRIGYYMKSKNIARIFKEKCPIFAAGGYEAIINLFSNSLEHMGYFSGHKLLISMSMPNIQQNICLWVRGQDYKDMEY